MATKPKSAAAKKSAAPKKSAPAKITVAKKAPAKPAKKVAMPEAVKKAAPGKKAAPAKKPARTIAKVVAKAKPAPKKKVVAIPKGHHSITPYLIMSDAQKAINFYQRVFGAKVSMKMDKPGGKIDHAEMVIGDAKIMLADECPEMGARAPQAYGGSAVSIHLYIKDVDGVVKKAVDAGAKLLMPVQNMYYGDRSGAVEDPFGHKWHIATHVEDVTPAMMKKRAAEMASKK